MGGTFTPMTYNCKHKDTIKNLLSIEIPSPFLHTTEENAMKDCDFAYRFIALDSEVVIAVYASEDFSVHYNENGQSKLQTWVKGSMFFVYTYDKFKELGGKIYEIPNSEMHIVSNEHPVEELLSELKNLESETEEIKINYNDYVVDATFAELFPMLSAKDKPVYIDNEAYDIRKE